MNKHIKYKDITGYYRDEGKGQALILLHGFGLDGSVWDSVVPALKNKFRLLVPDLPGIRHTGLSKEPLTVEWMADFVRAIAVQEGLTTFHLIGHSMGGYVALALAEKYSIMLETLGLFHSHPYADNAEKIKNRKRAIRFIKDHGAKIFIDELYQNLFGQDFSYKDKKEVLQLKRQAYTYLPEGLIALSDSMIKRPDRTKVLMNFPKPVLFILGKQDKIITPEMGLKQASLPEVSVVHILEKAGHMGMIECPSESIDIIGNFINLNL